MAYLEENPDLKENYFCSYIQDENYPSGTFSNIWWISSRVNNKDEDAIEKLIQLENIKGIKIFPRYYHHCALIEDVDRFCWKYGYLNIHLENLKNHTIRRHEKLEQELILEGIDFKRCNRSKSWYCESGIYRISSGQEPNTQFFWNSKCDWWLSKNSFRRSRSMGHWRINRNAMQRILEN